MTKELPASVGAELLDINRISIYYKGTPVSEQESSNVSYIEGQLSLFDQLEIDESIQEPEILNVTAHEKKKSRAIHDELAKNVPIRTVELEGDMRNCFCCNTSLEDIGSKVVREEIPITPIGNKLSAQFTLICSLSFLLNLATVLCKTPQLCAMFRSLNPKFFMRWISQYLVIRCDLLYLKLHPR